METCNGSFTENGGTDRHWVPHFLPGQNTEALTEWLTKGDPRTVSPSLRRTGSPLAAARGGLKTLYPEYRSTLDGTTAVDARVPPSRADDALRHFGGQEDRGRRVRDGEVHVLPVQGNVFMLVADGTNITASVGPEGVCSSIRVRRRCPTRSSRPSASWPRRP